MRFSAVPFLIGGAVYYGGALCKWRCLIMAVPSFGGAILKFGAAIAIIWRCLYNYLAAALQLIGGAFFEKLREKLHREAGYFVLLFSTQARVCCM